VGRVDGDIVLTRSSQLPATPGGFAMRAAAGVRTARSPVTKDRFSGETYVHSGPAPKWSVRHLGLRETLLRVLSRLRIVRSVHSLDVHVRDLDLTDCLAINRPEARSDGVHAEEVRRRDVGQLRFTAGYRDMEVLPKLFGRKSRRIAAFENGEVISTMWANTEYIHLGYAGPECVRLPEDVVYLHNVFTVPAARHRGLVTLMRNHVIDILRPQGRRYLISVVHLNNVSATRALPSFGYRHWGRLTRFRFAGRTIHWRRSGVAGPDYPNLLADELRVRSRTSA